MIRFFDIMISFLSIFILLPVFFLIFILCLLDTGSPLFFQIRIGEKLKKFQLIKFRTMKLNTASIGTHLVDKSAVTFLGKFLRKFKLDELPQLWNVLNGDMSIVGPRPCLLNQKKLIKERKKNGVFKVKPGITGLAQINGITMSSPKLLAYTDSKMIKKMNMFNYYYYIAKTFLLILRKNKMM